MGRVYYPQARAVLAVVFDGFGPTVADSSHLTIPAVPKEVTVHVNAYNQPDTWEAVFDANDLPIDPQLIRAGSAELYLFCTRGADSQQRILNQQFAGVEGVQYSGGDSLESATVDLQMQGAKDFSLHNRPRIVGTFDRADLDLSSSGKWLTISGQDYTAFLAAKQWPPKAGTTLPRPIPVGAPLHLWASSILSEVDTGHNMEVVVEGVNLEAIPIVGSAEIANKRLGIPIESDTTYWDVLSKVINRYGYICFVRGIDLVITRPKNLENLEMAPKKRIAWGTNLESVKLSRQLGKEKVPRIIINAYDPTTRTRVVVEYPENPQVGPGNKGSDEYKIIPVYGVTDRRILRNMAENLFHIIGKGERTIVATTRDLTDINDVDLLSLEAGDAVEIEWSGLTPSDRAVLASANASPVEKYQRLIDLGYSAKVAEAVSRNYEKLVAIKRAMSVKSATYKYSSEDGISVEMELVDFVIHNGLRETNNIETRKATRPARVRRATT